MPAHETKKAKTKIPSRSDSDKALEQILGNYVRDFIAGNRAAKVLADGLRVVGVGLRPLLDHLIFRTADADSRAKEFTAYGYAWDRQSGNLRYGTSLAKIYRKAGFPALVIEEGLGTARGRGKKGDPAEWIKAFGERSLFALAVCVDDLEDAVFYLEKQSVPFSGMPAGERGGIFRQVFAVPEMREGRPYTVLELVERHSGFDGFSESHFETLVQSLNGTD